LRATAAIFLALLLGSCAPVPSLLERILAAGELRVVTRNSPTTFYLGGADEHRGIEYALASGFAARLGVELVIYTTDQFRALSPEVARGAADIAAAGMQIADATDEEVTFGPGYQSVEQLIVYRMGTRQPASLSELMGGTLEVVAGSGAAATLAEAQQFVPYLQWTEKPAGSAETLLRRVINGESDYAVVPSSEFAVLQHYYPEARAAFALGSREQLAWALPDNAPQLREAVSAYFAEISATGELQQILTRDRHDAHEFDFVGSRAFVRHLHERFPRYQEYFKLAAAETRLDWRLLAAIAYQESHWDPGAVSPTGVRGLMMLTEHTSQIVGIADRSDAWESILGGSRYFRRVLDKFPTRIPVEDRLMLATAAYNIGFGHVEDARILTEAEGGNPDSWLEVRDHLPLLADEAWHRRVRRGYAPGQIPVDYVENVRRYRALLDWMQGTELVMDLPEPAPDPAAEPAPS
jgi:membrane-bound lytic murein transglycosylase F